MASRIPTAAVLVAALGLPGPALAVDPRRPLAEMGHDTWTTREGLPQNTVEAMVQTRDGYLWLGTQEGLARFDGVRFTVFDRAATGGVLGDNVTALLEARDGVLWAGTFTDGLACLSGGAARPCPGAERWPPSRVRALAQAADGAIWVASTAEGLWRLAEGGRAAVELREGPPQVRSLEAAGDGGMWVGTTNGLLRVDGVGARAEAVPELAGSSVTALAPGDGGGVWVGTTDGLWQGREGRWRRLTTAEGLPSPVVNALLPDRAGALWVATNGGVARLFEGRVQAFTRADGLGRDAVKSLLEDAEGNLWAGTDGGGLTRLHDGRLVTYDSRHGLSDDSPYVVAGARDGGLWFASYEGPVEHLVEGRVVPPRIPATGVRTLLEDREGVVWVGTDTGLLRVEGGRTRELGREQLGSDIVRALRQDRAGRLWIGTDGGGLSCLEGGRLRRYGAAAGLAGPLVGSLHEDARGVLWAGTNAGLGRLEPSGRFTVLTTADGLSHDHVRSVGGDGRDLWVTTYAGGLDRLRDGVFTSFRSAAGPLGSVLWTALPDGLGHLWLTGNRGLFRLRLSDLEALPRGGAPPVVAFDEADGMGSRECNGGHPAGWRTTDGRLWFPTMGGLVMVDPDRLLRQDRPPAAVVEGLRVDGEETGAPAAVVRPGHQRFEFQYTGVTFLSPQRLRFAYRLEGFDRGWVEAGRERSARYTRLAPGRYTFRVRARHDDGPWGPEAAGAPFSVQAALHETRTFHLGVVVLLVGGAFGAYRLRVRGLRRREAELQERVQQELARVRVLSGLLPICAHCKKIRDDRGYWNAIEVYIREHSEAHFSHGLCDACVRELYPDLADEVLRRSHRARPGGEA